MVRHTWCFKPRSKPNWLYVSQISYPRYNVNLSVSEGNFYVYLYKYALSASEVPNSCEEHCVYIYIYIYIYTRWLFFHCKCGWKMYHKFKLFWSVQLIRIQSFSSSRLIALARLKSPACPTIYPWLRWEYGIHAIPMRISIKWNRAPSRIWTWVTDSNSNEDNRYATHVYIKQEVFDTVKK